MKREDCRRKTDELFSQKQADVITRRTAHRAEIYEKFPQIAEFEQKMETVSAEFFTAMADGNLSEDGFNRLKTESLALQKEREEILTQNGYPADYLSFQYECPICKDEGFVGTEMCVCYKKALAEEFLRCSNMQKIYQNKNFRNFDLTFYAEGEDRRKMEATLEYCKTYARKFDKVPRNLLFLGAPGSGKTFLSCAIGTELIKTGHFVLYTPIQDMLDDFEKVRFGKGDADIESYKECDLLIIDDFGAEFKNSFSESVLYNIINDRLNEKKPMIISTNFDEDDIEENYHERLCSRLMYEFAKIQFAQVDIRREKERRLLEKRKNGK